MSNLSVTLPESTIVGFLESEYECAVDIELLVDIGVYSRKDIAVDALKRNFKLNVDYIVIQTPSIPSGRPKNIYKLTQSCFERMRATKRIATKPVITEKEVQRKLNSKLQGIMEIATESGNIDILTNTEVIEIKEVASWKSAIGQILVYGSYYPSHQKRIHIFGHAHSSIRRIIEKHCHRLDIKVTYED
jgi:hypothetical protein